MIKKIFQAIKEDIVHDYETIVSIFRQDGKYKIDKQILEEIKDPIGLLASQKIFIFVIILAFCSGWVVSSQYYESQCNDVVIDVIDNCENYLNYRNIGSFKGFDELNLTVELNESIS